MSDEFLMGGLAAGPIWAVICWAVGWLYDVLEPLEVAS